MGHLKRFLRRLINVMRPGREEAELEREIVSHLVLLEDDQRRRGLSAGEARRSARLALGGIEQTKERHRDARAFRWLDDARRDATYAVRMLRRHPVATATAPQTLPCNFAKWLNRSYRSNVFQPLPILRELRFSFAHLD